MKQLIFVALFLVFSINAQKAAHTKKYHYYDANFKEIPFLKFKKQEKSKLFKTVTYQNDTAYIKKLMYNEVFGNLDKTKHQQMKKLYSVRYHIDTTKTWFIHYIDSIPDKEKMPKKSGNAYYNKNNELIGYVPYGSNDALFDSISSKSSYHKHMRNYEDYITDIKKEIQSFEKGETAELIHFYNTNHGIEKEVLENYNYYKDSYSVLKKSFKEAVKSYQVIIIYPDGQFYFSFYGNKNYVSFGGSSNTTSKLLKKKYFNKKRKKWEKSVAKIL
ncbi:hypothetical protein [Tenacibaculum jejuense]|uniref:Uncharacterized protein n=1 Tax=Tenacibaculum jejuense TaxID=584609 RepID=A0A238UE98_9FLAO|nr:hypothetical protein [Tenacibaculum jejuense]SNR16908.1 exported protein of unknown function [Tenacibaculum jejuense]